MLILNFCIQPVDSFNMVILEQIFKKKIYLDFIMKILSFQGDGKNAYKVKKNTLQQGTHKIGFECYSLC